MRWGRQATGLTTVSWVAENLVVPCPSGRAYAGPRSGGPDEKSSGTPHGEARRRWDVLLILLMVVGVVWPSSFLSAWSQAEGLKLTLDLVSAWTGDSAPGHWNGDLR